jgi:hypothetical protein
MLRILLLTVLLFNLVACGHQPLAGKLSFVGDYWDAQDPCQRSPMPDFCGAGSARTVIYSTSGQPLGYIKK